MTTLRKPSFLVFLAIGWLVLPHAPASAEPSANPAPNASPTAAAPAPEEVPVEHHAEDPTAPEVTAKNLLANERFWPYRVSLARSWKGEGVPSELPSGTSGIVVRVEDEKNVRIDFGRNGLAEVPIAATDLVARSNGVRLGTERKYQPNFIEAIGPRLIDSKAEPMRPVTMATVYRHQGFVCVFADMSAPSLAEIAKALAPLARREDVMTVVFPQGRPLDVIVYERLRSVDWKVPFVFQHLSEPYTRTLIGEAPKLPYVTLQTSEGRLLLAKQWHDGLEGELVAAIDQAFGKAGDRVAVGEDPAKKR